MKKTRILATICAILLLAGCTTPAAPVDTAAPPKTTAPTETAPTGGETVTDSDQKGHALPLPTSDYFHHAMVKPSVEGRCAATSMGRMAETENGYYYVVLNSWLYYADKSDLSNWAVVCNQPDCSHTDHGKCNGYMKQRIWFKNGVLYAVNDGMADDSTVIVQSPGDGSQWTAAFSDESYPYYHSNGSSLSRDASDKGLFVDMIRMEADGFWDSYLYFVDENGSHVVKYAEDFPDMIGILNGSMPNQVRGDTVMPLTMEYPGAGVDIATGSEMHRISPECVEKLELPDGCPYYGAYLSGDTMIHYHPNDGFYKLDYYGGTEEKIADAAYTDGFGFCLDGEFLVETTVNWQSTAKECKLRYFDGKTWTEVPLPEDFTPETSLLVAALTSDTLFLENYAVEGALYMVKLGDNRLVKCMDYPDIN